jgi:hypothetical protein
MARLEGRLAFGVFLASMALTEVDYSAAYAAGRCTSIQAQCALEIGGVCDPKTGHWQFGRFHEVAVGGTTILFDECVSRKLAQQKSRR